jgi:very-short-patch-repair endonuclease
MAWLAQLRRTDLRARQALQGWADTQRKIGKGKGKRTPQLQAKARQLLEEARGAVPVWIMPLSRVAESFGPVHGRFDVVVVDEASQSDAMGLLAWYLGDRVAVVGDHEQVSPLAVGQELEAVQALIAQHLSGIPNHHLYDGTTSVYHLARQCFGGTIALREHFRCVPDIIEFSNYLAYNGEIRPLRSPSAASRPHLVECVVDASLGPSKEGKENLAEARLIAAVVKTTTEMPEFNGKTMGAITLLGDDQAYRIQELCSRLVGAGELDRRRFVAGNSAQYQGDERDVMFLSMVDVPTGSPLTLKSADLFKQRYNVATSRARDQLWLIHSLNSDRDLKAGDLRRLLIEHFNDPTRRRRAVREAEQRAESPFEAEVARRLIAANYRVRSQQWVGHYRIDMVVGEESNQVAVECDGDRFHGFENVHADMARQAVLERASWRFIRIRGTRFYRDPEAEFARVLEELQRYNVDPIREEQESESSPANDGTEFRERVLWRAWQIMREQGWIETPPQNGDKVQAVLLPEMSG